MNSNCSFNLISSLRIKKEGGREGVGRKEGRRRERSEKGEGFPPPLPRTEREREREKKRRKKSSKKLKQKKKTHRHQGSGALAEDVHQHRLPRSDSAVHVEPSRGRREGRRHGGGRRIGSRRSRVRRGPAEERREPAPTSPSAASTVADRPHHRQARARRRAGLDVAEQPLQLQHGALLARVLPVEPRAAPRGVDRERAPRRRPDLWQGEEGVAAAAAIAAAASRSGGCRLRRRDGVSDDVLDLLEARGAGVEGRGREERRKSGRRSRCRRRRPMERRDWASSTRRFREESSQPCLIRTTGESSAFRELKIRSKSRRKTRNNRQREGSNCRAAASLFHVDLSLSN